MSETQKLYDSGFVVCYRIFGKKMKLFCTCGLCTYIQTLSGKVGSDGERHLTGNVPKGIKPGNYYQELSEKSRDQTQKSLSAKITSLKLGTKIAINPDSIGCCCQHFKGKEIVIYTFVSTLRASDCKESCR